MESRKESLMSHLNDMNVDEYTEFMKKFKEI